MPSGGITPQKPVSRLLGCGCWDPGGSLQHLQALLRFSLCRSSNCVLLRSSKFSKQLLHQGYVLLLFFVLPSVAVLQEGSAAQRSESDRGQMLSTNHRDISLHPRDECKGSRRGVLQVCEEKFRTTVVAAFCRNLSLHRSILPGYVYRSGVHETHHELSQAKPVMQQGVQQSHRSKPLRSDHSDEASTYLLLLGSIGQLPVRHPEVFKRPEACSERRSPPKNPLKMMARHHVSWRFKPQ